MRRFFFFLIIAGFAFTGCSGLKRPEPETKFFRDFSLDEIVERVPLLELKRSSGSSDYSSSPGVKGRRDFSLTYIIVEGEGATFDEVRFITKLKAETERVADDAGARKAGGGLSGDAFYFDYSDEDHEGWVEVIGTRIEGNRYKVWGVVRENTKKATQ